MSLQHITEEGDLYWLCHNEDECGCHLRAHVHDLAVQHIAPPKSEERQGRILVIDAEPKETIDASTSDPLKGSVVALPQCPECGSQMFLKADYSIKEVVKGKVLEGFVDDQGRHRGYAMRLPHARNFRLLNMLYEAGKLPAPPLLPVLSLDAINVSPLAGLPLDIVDSFFLPYALFGRAIDIEGIDQHILALSSHITPLATLIAPDRVLMGAPSALPMPTPYEGEHYQIPYSSSSRATR